MDLRRSSRPRVVKKKSDIVYFDDQRIELTDQEKDLIYPSDKAKEKRYCFCKRTEQEAIGLTMVQCDSCHDWFHDECLGRRSEELEQLEVYYCPSCSNSKYSKRKPQPSNAELELLLAALAEIDEEKPKYKKKEVKVQTAQISVFHFTEPIAKYPNLVGVLRNESSSAVEDNKLLIGIFKHDIDRGFVWTPWGTYRVTLSDDKILACTEGLGKPKDSKPESPVESVGKVVDKGETVEITGGDFSLELPKKRYRFDYDEEKGGRILKMVNCAGFDRFREYVRSNLKNKGLKELFYNN